MSIIEAMKAKGKRFSKGKVLHQGYEGQREAIFQGESPSSRV